MNQFQSLFLALDAKLTAKQPAEVARQYHHYRDNLLDWYFKDEQGVWYLADAGYSRVAWNSETGLLFLTYNSTHAVKGRWESALPERQALEAFLAQEWENLHKLASLK